jgi:cytochrome b
MAMEFVSLLRGLFFSPPSLIIVPVLGLVLARLIWKRWGSSKAVRVAAMAARVAGLVYVVWAVYAIKTSHSSTAGIGFIVIPQITVMVCGVTFLVFWSAAILVLKWRGSNAEGQRRDGTQPDV